MTRLEILKNEIFKDVPPLSRDIWYAVGWDNQGREVIVPCRDRKEAARKKALLQELLELQEKEFSFVPFLIDSGELAEDFPDDIA